MACSKHFEKLPIFLRLILGGRSHPATPFGGGLGKRTRRNKIRDAWRPGHDAPVGRPQSTSIASVQASAASPDAALVALGREFAEVLKALDESDWADDGNSLRAPTVTAVGTHS
jgi:hypothetical protein